VFRSRGHSGSSIAATNIRQGKGKAPGKTSKSFFDKDSLKSLSIFQSRVKVDDISVFSRGFATMVGAGVPLAQCLDILIDQTENATLSKATADIKAEVEGGGSLSEALGKYPKIFDNLYVNMIRAGEASGQLEPIFNQLADLLERQRDLRNRVKSALFLPIMVMGFCVLITIALIVFVVPRFANIFEMMNAPLPGPTQMLINISRDIRGPKGLIAIVAISLLAFAIRKVIKTEQGGRIWDQIKLKLPLFGSLIMKKIVANFARTYGLLDRSGVPILESLDIVAQTAGNRIVSRSIMEARSGVQEGEDLSKRLEQSRIFPPMVTQMIVVGEKTGTVETMLFKIAELYEADVERTVEGLTKLIEPMMMILVGVLVGSILICMYLPIFNMAGLMSGGV
jgi:type IV pilus assembly protein PilC